jgi:hypothetical protein
MSEAKETDLKDLAECYGEWDQKFKECTEDCTLGEQCRRATLAAQKPKPPAPALEAETELPEMDPVEFLLESIKGRYDIEAVKKAKATIYRVRKDTDRVARVTVVDNGMVQIETRSAKLQLKALESVKQASEIFKALLVV